MRKPRFLARLPHHSFLPPISTSIPAERSFAILIHSQSIQERCYLLNAPAWRMTSSTSEVCQLL
jgi:hypothetical protein